MRKRSVRDEKTIYLVTIKEEFENRFHGLRYRGFMGRRFPVSWNRNWGHYTCGVHFFLEEELEFADVVNEDFEEARIDIVVNGKKIDIKDGDYIAREEIMLFAGYGTDALVEISTGHPATDSILESDGKIIIYEPIEFKVSLVTELA